MEIWEKLPSSHYRHPSFSSTLLDQIYRSIDDSSPLDSTIIKLKKQQRNTSLHEDRQLSPLFHRRSVAADFEGSRRRTSTDFLKHSNSGSSDSSGGFSSSDYASPQQPKHIRKSSLEHSSTVQKPKELGGFLRTKSKALKIYSDLKKVKQPISPGGRLATFLNSLFPTTTTKPKKTLTTSVATTVSSSSTTTTTTTCSSASSFSRSCLSKTPTSSGKSKRSVRFCPVNVILDEDTSSSFHIPYPRLYGNSEPKRDVVEEHRRVIEAAKDLIRTYHNNKKTSDDNINVEEDYDDDVASCASSDLFELENLSPIGIERYRQELPVYETTRLDNTNRAIATRYIV